jgi:hypothetical protein
MCCHFDQEDYNYSVWIFLTKLVFLVNFRKNSSADEARRRSLLGRRGGDKAKEVAISLK